MNGWLYLVFLLLLLGSTVHALITGRARRRNFTLITREEEPGSYWFVVVGQAVGFVLVVYLWSRQGFGW